MAIIIKTDNPQALKKQIYDAIDHGNMPTWARRTTARDQITHVTSDGQWKDKAWFTIKDAVATDELILCIGFPATGNDLNKVRDIYGVYHGRFTERLLIQFYKNIKVACSTPKPKDYESIPELVKNKLME